MRDNARWRHVAPRPRTTPVKTRKPRAAGARADLQQWMQRTPTLVQLRQQALDSQRMWQTLLGGLPPALAGAVQPGRCAQTDWSLSVSSPAVAAKLKLFLPLLLRRLQQEGWPVQRIAVRVRDPQALPAPPAPPPPASSRAPAAVRARLRELRAKRAAAG
jgi:hypothetical protein